MLSVFWHGTEAPFSPKRTHSVVREHVLQRCSGTPALDGKHSDVDSVLLGLLLGQEGAPKQGAEGEKGAFAP